MFIKHCDNIINLNQVIEFKKTSDVAEGYFSIEFTMTDGSKRYFYYDKRDIRDRVYYNILKELRKKDMLLEEDKMMLA